MLCIVHEDMSSFLLIQNDDDGDDAGDDADSVDAFDEKSPVDITEGVSICVPHERWETFELDDWQEFMMIWWEYDDYVIWYDDDHMMTWWEYKMVRTIISI